jgi:hypothetical protein
VRRIIALAPGFVLAATLCLNTAFAELTDRNVYPAPDYAMAPPEVGQSYVDPVFGATIKRLSNALEQPNADSGTGFLTFITTEYSSMSPFNSDNTKVLAVFQSYFALYDGDGNFLGDLPREISASSEPRWSRHEPNTLYYIHLNQLKSHNVSSGETRVIRRFDEYRTISGKGESDICFDGNHFVLVGDGREIFVYDIAANVKGAVLNARNRAFDSVYITPNDNVTVTWANAGNRRFAGIELFDRDMRFIRQVAPAGGHMDVTRDTNGDEVLLLANAADPRPVCDNGIVKTRLADGAQTCLLSLDWSLAVHVSAPDQSGWVFVETYAPSDPLSPPAWTAYTNEILQIKLDGSEIRRLAHHRSRPFNSYNYQPRVSSSRDGSRLIYNSNFGLQASGDYPTEYSDVYMIALSGASSGGSVPVADEKPSQQLRVEQDDPAVVYNGAWYIHNNAGHSGGSAKLAMDTGSLVSLTFSGSGVRWSGYRDEWSGIANVYIDGEFRGSVDSYASPAQFGSVLFEATGLPAGNHTLTIEVAGARHPLSGGYWVWVDAFDVVP